MAEALGRPMAGLRVVDLTHDWAGPHATRILADYGAEVIKVEYARRLDAMRGGLKEGRAYDHHPRWHQLNRNKRSVTLDLADPADQATFRDLVAISDVIVESSRVGVLGRLGFGYDELSRIRPEIILVSMSPFGQTGPEASYAAYGGGLEALSGIQSLTAYGPGSRPRRIREVDVTNGIMGTCAIMTALVYRQRTGRGQWVDLSQLEAATSGLIGDRLLECALNGGHDPPAGNRHPRLAPWGCYRCRGEDRWVAIAVRTDAEWRALCDIIARPAWGEDPRFASAPDRCRNRDEIDEEIGRWTILREDAEAMWALQAAGVAAGAVVDVADLRRDPHLAARGYFLEAADGTGPHPGLPFRLSGGAGEVRTRGPHLGEHNTDVLGGLLGQPDPAIRTPSEEEVLTAYDVPRR
jgi:crotonobetainyl-CoA:carnitine CoA-transferase CaiB-like acyl-CoA transferase